MSLIKCSGKEYKQYWYHYGEWREGDRVIKKYRYIPKRLVPKVERMNQEKVSVRKILEVLGVVIVDVWVMLWQR